MNEYVLLAAVAASFLTQKLINSTELSLAIVALLFWLANLVDSRRHKMSTILLSLIIGAATAYLLWHYEQI